MAAPSAVPTSHVAVAAGPCGRGPRLLEAVVVPGAVLRLAVPLSIALCPTWPAWVRRCSTSNGRRSPRPGRDGGRGGAGTDLVFVCNPNNPTGTVVHRAKLEDFLDRVPRDCLVVLDEAYTEYVRDPSACRTGSACTGTTQPGSTAHLLQAYGPGRPAVGFMVAHEPVATAVPMLAFTVNALAQAAALVAPGQGMLERVEAVVKERGRVRHELLAQGWTCRRPRRLAAPRRRSIRRGPVTTRGGRAAVRRRGRPGVDR